MILQALGQFHERMAAGSVGALAPSGFEFQHIPFVIVLDQQGGVVRMEDTRSATDRRWGKPFLVPRGVKKTNGISPNLFWDTPSYLLGHSEPGPPGQAQRNAERAQKRQRAFIEQIRRRFGKLPEDEGIKAVLLFLERRDYRLIYQSEKWQEVKEKSHNLTFRLVGDDCLVCERPAVTAVLSENSLADSQAKGPQMCLMTGAKVTPVRIHSSIKGVRGTIKGGANIVSFGKDSCCSFGLRQGDNAPIGKPGEFAYTTAVNFLLGTPKHRLQIGDATVIFWSEGPSVLEEVFAELFVGDNAARVKGALGRIAGLAQGDTEGLGREEGSFFLLALAPNVARLAIRLWYRGTVTETARNLLRHFQESHIAHPARGPESPSLSRLLLSTAPQGKPENMQSQLGCDLLRSILSGAGYPQALLTLVLRRCRVEGTVTHERAALIKAVLTRQEPCGDRRGLAAELDVGRTETGYLLGRLLSLIQHRKKPGSQVTAPNTHFGIASCRPVVMLPHLLEMKSRLRGLHPPTLLEQLAYGLQESLPEIPAFLPLQGQAFFALGCYHQQQALPQDPTSSRSSR